MAPASHGQGDDAALQQQLAPALLSEPESRGFLFVKDREARLSLVGGLHRSWRIRRLSAWLC